MQDGTTDSSKPKTPKINPKNPKITPFPNFSKENQPKGGGRPKGSVSVVSHLKRLLSEGNEARAKQLGIATIKHAIKGNPVAIKIIFDRIDGVLTEKHEIDMGENMMAAVAALLSGERGEKK